MISSRLDLQSIAPKELDEYLEKGWYRIGQSIFTTQFLCFNDSLYTAIWLRLNLQGYKMRKSLRKIFNKVNKQFTVVYQPATFGADKEALFSSYKLSFKGEFNSSINGYMLDNKGTNVYQTMECVVYDGDKLIAFSYFDLGEKCIASILGVYDTDYSKYSLGIFTMLAEINWALDNNYTWYYPGYSVPGYYRFDYKHRIGEVEYFDYGKQKWASLNCLETSDLLSEQLKEKILIANSLVHKFIKNSYIIFYRYYDAWYLHQAEIYDHPLMLLYSINKKGYILEYDLKKQIYRLSSIITLDLHFVINENIILHQKVVELRSPLACEEIIFETDNVNEMSQEILLMFLLEK